MAKRATKDTFGTEFISGVPVRRLVKAGQQYPAHLDLEDPGAAEEFDPGATLAGYPAEVVADGETDVDIGGGQSVRRRGRPPKPSSAPAVGSSDDA